MRKSVAAALLFFSLPAFGKSVSVDWLHWQASQETASYWANKLEVTNEFVFAPQNTHFDYEHGLRVGTETDVGDGFWKTYASWTYMPSKTSDSIEMGVQYIMPEFFSGFLSENFFFGADMDWKIDMHAVDAGIGHSFDLGGGIELFPSIGLKAARIFQNVDVDWDALVYVAHEEVEQKYYGLGPSLNLGAAWKFYNGFSIVGSIKSAFMWGRWDVEDVYHRPNAGLITETTITTSMNDSDLGTLMMDYFVGLRYETEKPFLAFRAGYEMQYWANQLRLPTFQELPEHGDLTYQGVTCGIHVYF